MFITLQWNGNSADFTSYFEIREHLRKTNFQIYAYSDAKVITHTRWDSSIFLKYILPFGYLHTETFRLLDLYPSRWTAFWYTPLKLVAKCPTFLDSLKIPAFTQQKLLAHNDLSAPNTKKCIYVWQYSACHGPFSLWQLRKFDLLGCICKDDKIIFSTTGFLRSELYLKEGSAFEYFPLFLRFPDHLSTCILNISMQYPISIQQDYYWYGPFTVEEASDLFIQRYIKPQWNNIATYPESIPLNQLPVEFESYLLTVQPGAFIRDTINLGTLRTKKLLETTPMGNGARCSNSSFQRFNGAQSRSTETTKNIIIGDLTNDFSLMSIKETAIADGRQPHGIAPQSLPHVSMEQPNGGLINHFQTSEAGPCVSNSIGIFNPPVAPSIDSGVNCFQHPPIQRQSILKPDMVVGSSTVRKQGDAGNIKLNQSFSECTTKNISSLENSSITATNVGAPTSISAMYGAGSSIESGVEKVSTGSPKSITLLSEKEIPSVLSLSFNTNSSVHSDKVTSDALGLAKSCSQQEIDLDTQPSTPFNQLFPRVNTPGSTPEQSLININQRPLLCPSYQASTDQNSSRTKQEVSALEKWTLLYDEFPSNMYQLLLDHDISSLRQLYSQTATVESLADTLKPIKKKQFLQIYGNFKSKMYVVFEPGQSQPSKTILRKCESIRKKRLWEFLNTLSSKFSDWEDDSKEDSGAVLEATELFASVTELKQQLTAENAVLEEIINLLFSDDGCSTSSEERDSTAANKNISEAVEGLSKRAVKKQVKASIQGKLVASSTTIACACNSTTTKSSSSGNSSSSSSSKITIVEENGSTGFSVISHRNQLTKGAEYKLQLSKELHQQRARRLKSIIESKVESSSIHATQYYSMTNDELILRGGPKKKVQINDDKISYGMNLK